MMYLCLIPKHSHAAYDWADADLVEAEGPSQAAKIHVEGFHGDLGHDSESGCVRVKRASDDPEQWIFNYSYWQEPRSMLKWVRPPHESYNVTAEVGKGCPDCGGMDYEDDSLEHECEP